ncbi:DUF1934 domain-containing protein [Solibacillus sp. FSL H8-0538]|uniref:DUF1934 domain-containing protein n=1 Tax=Solibacillus sp. FSL H8-0538 TaxID=2921400 RepID=UPI0030FA6BCC
MNEAGTEVKIKLVSSIIPTEGELETYEMWLQGTFVEKTGKPYLRYEEVQEDKTIRTTVKLTNDQALIMRSGGVNMRLPLNTTQREQGSYESPYGSLPIETKTHQLAVELEQGSNVSGRFITQYDLIIGGTSVGNYTLEIHYSEVQS